MRLAALIAATAGALALSRVSDDLTDDELLFGPSAYGREKRPAGPAQPEKSSRKAMLAEKAERRRQRQQGPDQ